jgi:hypothetical protein
MTGLGQERLAFQLENRVHVWFSSHRDPSWIAPLQEMVNLGLIDASGDTRLEPTNDG